MDTVGARTVTVDGLRLRATVQGRGQPLLLVMGIGGSIEMWEPLVDALNGFQTIAFDAPGSGESERPSRPLRMPGLARLTDGLLAALGYGKVDVLGVSYGGAIAQQLAYQHPDRVRRLVLAATTCGLGAVPGNPLTLLLLATPFRYYSPALFKAVAPRLYGGATRRRPELAEGQAVARLLRAPSLRGYLFQLTAIAGWSSLRFLRHIRQPTLVITGGDDPIVPAVNGRILAGRIPAARLHLVHGGGHLFLLDQAAEAAAIIGEFLRSGES